MDRVILLKDYNGLRAGTELFFDKTRNTFGYEEIEETIGDNIHATASRSVAFSRGWVESLLGKLFTTPEQEAAISEHQDLINQYETRIAEMQEELEQLKNIK